MQSAEKTVVKDSLSAAKFLDSLSENHFYLTEVKNVNRINDSIIIEYNRGQNYNIAKVKLSDDIINDLG